MYDNFLYTTLALGYTGVGAACYTGYKLYQYSPAYIHNTLIPFKNRFVWYDTRPMFMKYLRYTGLGLLVGPISLLAYVGYVCGNHANMNFDTRFDNIIAPISISSISFSCGYYSGLLLSGKLAALVTLIKFVSKKV